MTSLPPPLSDQKTIYRSSNRPWLFLFASWFVVGLGARLAGFIAFGEIVMIVSVLMTPLLIFMRLMFPIEVRAEGVRCYDGLGIYHFVTWNEMKSTYRIWIGPGLSYVAVRHGEGMAMTVPLYLEGFDQFAAQISYLAPRENVLRRELEKRQRLKAG